MANKQLTASVRLNTTNAEDRINRLVKKINKLNSLMNKANTSSGASGISSNAQQMARAIGEGDKAAQRLAQNLQKSNRAAYEQWWKEQLIAQEKQEQLQQELNVEKARQQSLNTLSRTDKVAQRLQRTQYETWWKAQLMKQEWQKAHPILSKISTAWSKIDQKIRQVISGNPKLTSAYTTITSKLGTIGSKITAWYQKQRDVTSATKSTDSALGSIGSKLKTILATYLGIQSAQKVMQTSDIITSAENRLNNIEGGSEKQTAESMDKMYAAAQRSRSAYSDMLSNVSKTMALAGDSFQGNIDNAVRFQEIMSKAYTIGGASAQEQATSMYQLVQALGSGLLQGDELRSVREGAPIAYKKIEEFAQGVFNTEESLKDLASQGVITSDIIVAAIMNSEDEINKSFENTQMTFAQAWDKIKNSAIKAFEPILQKLNDFLNSTGGQATIEGVGNALVWLANVVGVVIDAFATFFNWCADNWEWLKYIIVGALLVIMALFVKTAAVAIVNALITAWAWLKAHWALLLIVAAVMAILYVYELWRQGSITLTEALVYCALIIAAAFLIAGIIMMSVPMLIAAAIIALLAIIFYFFAEICGAATWFGLLMRDVALEVANFFIACWNWILTAGGNALKGIANFAIALGKSIGAICTNIGVAFNNAWHGALSGFWDFVASCLEGLDWLAKPISKIAELFGKSFDYSSFTESVRGKVEAHSSKMKDYVSVSDAWNSGMNTYQYKDLGDAWSSGINTFDAFEKGWSKEYYNVGYDWGSGVTDSINSWGSQFQSEDNKAGIFSDLGGLLGTNDLNSLDGSGGLLNPNDPTYALGDAYDPSGANDDIAKGLKELNGTTDDIRDSVDLTDDDLEYLRKIAEMEWKKEYTTANITVDMSNYNTINGDADLDGIVTKLSEKLYEEMNVIADGVYA